MKAFITLLVLLAGTVALPAQTSNGTIAGVITDQNGAVVQNASVTAINNANGEKHTTTTNGEGSYRIESVSSGRYTVQVKASNFAELKLSEVVVAASVVTTADGKLKVGSAETVVEVNAIGQQLQTESNEISHNISSAEVTSLVVPGLNPIELVTTEPGVSRPGPYGFSNGFDFSVNGARPRSNNFLIEGSDNNDAAIQGQAFQVTNLEATKELSILTNSYAAEFGHGAGSVTNLIYKSGGNQWHGSIFDLVQNSSLDSNKAENKLNGTARDISRENTYGFTIGGPIKHDKLFIFGSSQWDKTRQTADLNSLTVPSAAGFATLQGLPQTQNLTNYLQAIGSLRGVTQLHTIALGPNLPNVEVGSVQRTVANPANDTQYVIKGDYVPNSKDTLSLRYTYDTNNLTPDTFNLRGQLAGFDTQQGGTSHNAGVTETHIFSPNVINELRVSFSRIGFAFSDTPQTLANPLGVGPTINIGGLVTGFGAPAGIPQARAHDTFQYQDSVSWIKGHHSLKFGVDLAQIKVVDAIPFNGFGTINYNAGGGFSAFGNFIDDFTGTPGSISRAFGSPLTRPHYFNQNYFAQDSWKLRPNLTLDVGLRYEYSGTPENNLAFPAIVPVQGFNGAPAATFVPEQANKNNWGPRVGFAYTPRFWTGLLGQDKTVIRAGFGIFYDGFFTNIIDNSAASSPNVISPLLVGTAAQNGGRGIAAASQQFAALNPTPNPRNSVTTIANNLKAPTTLQWHLDIQRELGAQFTLTASYVGTRGERLFASDQFNPFNPSTGLRLDPNLGSVRLRDNSGDSIYHALDLKLDRRFSKGLLVRGAYTFSKNIDDVSEVYATTGSTFYPVNLIVGNRGLDRGLSAYNHSHVVSLTYVYDIPKVKGDGGFVKALGYVTNGWQTSGTYFYQTGSPNTVVDGFDANGDGELNDRPSLGNPAAPLATYAEDSSFVRDPITGNLLPTGTLCDGPRAFAGKGCQVTSANNVHWIIPAGGVGNVGRNTIVNPGQQDTTFALQRIFNFHSERQQFMLRMETLNPFNHPNTGTPTFNLTAIPVAGIGPFGNYNQTENGQRVIRFKLRYSF